MDAIALEVERIGESQRYADKIIAERSRKHADESLPELNGQCEAAFKFYERCFGAQLGPIFRYAGTPLGDQVPADWQDKVMHGSLTVDQLVLMGGDVAPDRYETPRGFSLSLQLKDTTEAERIFGELAKEGKVSVPLEKTFWAERFGMVVDRFGIPWLINCEGST